MNPSLYLRLEHAKSHRRYLAFWRGGALAVFGVWLMLLVLGLPGIGQAAQSQAHPTPYIDIRDFGAVGDGRTNDTEALASAARACTATGGILYLPYTPAAYTTTRSFDLPSSCDLKIDGVLRATAPMEAVITVGAHGTATRHKIFGVGTIDSGNLAKRHIALSNYAHFDISGVTLLNSGSIAGIDIGPQGSKGGFEAYIHDLTLFVPQGVAATAGSAGIWSDKGTDSSVYNLAIVGWDTGVRNNIHGNQPFDNIHVWGFGPNPGWHNVSNLPSVCFDDAAGDAQWISDECDTPTQIGLRARAYNDQIVGFSCFNNEIWGSDNVVNCIQFDTPRPYSTVMNSIFTGRKGHRLASDVAAPQDSFTQIEMVGNVAVGFVTKTHSLTTHFTNETIENTLALGGPLRSFAKGGQLFTTPTGSFRFELAGSPVAEITSSGTQFHSNIAVDAGGSYAIGSTVVLPKWLSAYAGGTGDTAVQLATGPGTPQHLPAYDATGGLRDSGKTLARGGDLIPTVTNTMGCLDGWDHLPCTVAKLVPSTGTTSSSAVTGRLFTTTAPTGVYQVTVTVHALGSAAAGRITPVAVLGSMRVPGAAALAVEGSSSSLSSATSVVDEKAGVSLGYAVDLADLSNSTHYTLSAEVIRLQ